MTAGLCLGTAAAATPHPACDASAHFQLLQPDPEPALEARALWRDRVRLHWPGAPAAAQAWLQAGDQRLALQPDSDGWRVPAGDADADRLRALHRGPLQLMLVDAAGREQRTRVQHAAALDDLFADAATDPRPLGVQPSGRGAQGSTAFALWAPTAREVLLCLYDSDRSAAVDTQPLQRDSASGTWRAMLPGNLSGHYYTYLVEVWVPGTGQVLQRVTDPYSISLGADSRRAWIGDLNDPALAPPGWAHAPRPRPAAALTDMAVYELHVRDFSVGDARVPPGDRGRYAAFSHARSHGMRHLRSLARAGLTDVHLLPVFDFASVPETGCSTSAAPASLATDCFNWGYDPLHFNAPEGSYASRADDGAVRIREFRRMVMALHRAGLRVGMDVVYNHLSASGQAVHSVLDRIVPGYYHRLDEAGRVATSTCCANSATNTR